MCPLYPVHFILMYAFVLLPIWLICSSAQSISASKPEPSRTVQFYPERIDKLVEGTSQVVSWTIPKHWNASEMLAPVLLQPEVDNLQIADVSSVDTVYLNRASDKNFSFTVNAKFLGRTFVRVSPVGLKDDSFGDILEISVIRRDTVLDKIFLYSVVTLVSLAYINMGCSLDLKVVWDTIRRPVGPAVGISCQYLCMPLLAFGLSQLFLTSSPSLQLGLFVTGCSPGGGASNIWTVLLNGNLNLSITLTFVSTVLALALMPAWIFSLGRVIFNRAKLIIPYKNIIYMIVALLVPVSIGVAIRKKCPGLADGLVKLTRPFSLLLIVYIFTFGIYANVYVFYLITLDVILSSVCLIWFGFAFGYCVARFLGFSTEDIIAISIETGIQNTGVAILLLKLSLPQPDADMTFVIPIMAATAMPIPLTMVWCTMKVRQWVSVKSSTDLGVTGVTDTVPEDGKAYENGGSTHTKSSSNGSYVAIGTQDDSAAAGV
ncbi:unnamed protein product [Notodromas monacha]|uniref:Uncharacterized protein n=1 Tax=Notodromas monacha TaxID=399045 RepID=A0A7R9BLL4_9CRUS|nr:unnamed protein product [Notodromas monacha]CAG0916422.1 unnamed protein product [Notodromas monacha]